MQNAPQPLTAQYRRLSGGWSQTLRTIRPSISRAISVFHSGAPAAKLSVPSIPSMIQRRSPRARLSAFFTQDGVVRSLDAQLIA